MKHTDFILSPILCWSRRWNGDINYRRAHYAVSVSSYDGLSGTKDEMYMLGIGNL